MRLLAAFLLLLAPLAAAGSQDDPEIVDAAGDASPPAANQWGDVTAAWFEEAGNGTLTGTIQVSSLVRVPPMTAYLLLFDAAESSWYAGIVFVDAAEPAYYTGEWDRAGNLPASETEAKGSVEGTRLSVTFARDDVGAEDAAALTALEAGVFDYKTQFIVGAVPTWLDRAEGQRDFAFAPAAVGDEAAPAPGGNAAPSAPLALLLGGLGVAAMARRR